MLQVKVGDTVLISSRSEMPWDESLERYYGHLGIVMEEMSSGYKVFIPTVHTDADLEYISPGSTFYRDEITKMVPA